MSDLYRGSTPIIALKVKDPDFDMTKIGVCHVTMVNDSGRNKKVFEDPAIDIEERTIVVDLSQEDTLAFEKGNIELQARVKLLDTDRVIVSPIILTTMKDILEGDVIL